MNQFTLVIIWISIGALSRILPHPADVTALTSLSLLAGLQFSYTRSLLIVGISLLLSDLTLTYLWNYPAFGSWSLFTYSGYAVIALVGHKVCVDNKPRLFGMLISLSMFYWLWTNFGTWLLSGLYPHTALGFTTCYTAALPFLRNSLLGDIAWMVTLYCLLKYLLRASTHGIGRISSYG